jgi:lipopolysaccharide/colanic/teichoic acid biosynthesis glycosyltransferase
MLYLSASNSKEHPAYLRKRRYAGYRVSKRLIDIVGALLALTFLLPVILLITAALILQDGFPVIYRQRRIGRHGKEFSCLKFRTMARDAEARLEKVLATSPDSRKEWEDHQKLQNDPRIHWLGHLLRKSSLDEIPQFLNVIRGEMSLVGPRPIVKNEISRYEDAFQYYIAMKPGITGYWQVSGRSNTSYHKRVKFDTQYFYDQSLLIDFKVIIKTVGVVLLARGSC